MNNESGSNDQAEKHIFSSDRPIAGAKDDQLNRSKFSLELAESIRNWNEKDSLVLAIYGQWGDGKSSVKNLVKEIYEKSNEIDTPLVIEFNPWQWSGEDHITEAFFKEISNKLGQSDDKLQRLVAQNFLDYAEYLELGNELALKAKKITEKILLLATTGTGLLSSIVSEQKKAWLIGASVVLLILTLALNEVIWCLKWLAKIKNIKFKTSKGLEDKKLDLSKSLSQMKKPVIVIIDDIDRLSRNEIKILFKIIKANADFPNIVYLTFFQRDIVEKSLNEKNVYEGKEFLKKIVQVGFDLPKVPSADIHKILFKALDKLLSESKLDQKFDQARWNEIFIDGIGDYFKNLRDVNRFISTFSFHLGILKTNKTYEINFIDLVGLEVLRQFEPKVYESIFFAKKLLTSSSSSGHSRLSDEAAKKQVTEILDAGNGDKKENIKVIIKVLFPNVQWAWGSNYHYSVGDEEFVKLRVNHEDRFNRYFSLYLPDEDIPQSDFEYAISIASDENTFYSFAMKYYEQGRLPLFIKKFEAYKQEVNKAYAVPFISAILRLGDLLTDINEGMFGISAITHARRIIHFYFKKQDFDESKETIYWEIMKNTTAIFLPIDLLWEEVERRNIENYPENYIFYNLDIESIKKLLIEKIEENKDKDAFKNNIHLPRIIFVWTRVDEDNARVWLEEYLKDDMNLVMFLIRLESKGFSSSGYETKVNYSIHLSWLKLFFNDLEELFARIKDINKRNIFDDEITKRVIGHFVKVEDQYRNPEKHKDIF